MRGEVNVVQEYKRVLAGYIQNVHRLILVFGNNQLGIDVGHGAQVEHAHHASKNWGSVIDDLWGHGHNSNCVFAHPASFNLGSALIGGDGIVIPIVIVC